MRLSIATTESGPINKTIAIDDNGEITKTHAKPLSAGRISTFDVDLETIANHLKSEMREDQCFVHGAYKGSEHGQTYNLVSVKNYNGGQKKGNITRTKKFLEFEGNHLSMLDYDPDSQCPHPYLEPKDLLRILAEIDPQWKDVGYVVAYSSGAGICLDGEQISQDMGYHLYFEVEHAEGLKKYMDWMFKQTILSGHGWIKVSSVGRTLVRSCYDNAVYSAERIDFIAPPTLKNKRLTQVRPPVEFYDGGTINCMRFPDVE